MFLTVSDYICDRCILPGFSADTKESALRLLSGHAARLNTDLDSEEIFRILMERENLASTGMGQGLAIPHGKVAGLHNMLVIVARSREGIPFDAIDKRPVHIIFLLMAPDDATTAYLKVLARISRLLKKTGIYDAIMEAGSAQAIARIIESADVRN